MISAPTFKRANRAEPTDMRRFMRDNRVKHYFRTMRIRERQSWPYRGRMVSAPTAVTAVRRFSQRSITRNYALPAVNSCEKAGNSGILCETRREVLRTQERTLVRDRTGMVLTTPYRAKLRIAGCQFLRKVGNSGILCETRREVLRTQERTSVRDQVLRFSQRSIARNYALFY